MQQQHWRSRAAKLQEQQLFVKQNMNTVYAVKRLLYLHVTKGLFSSHFATLQLSTLYNLITQSQIKSRPAENYIGILGYTCNICE